MIRIFKSLVFLLAIVLVVQCDREQSVETEGDGNPLQELNILSFDALPAEIQSKIITAETELKATDTHHKALKPFGSPKFNTIHQRLGDNGSQSYTLALEKTSEGLYYDNLVINQDAEGNTRTHIIRYQPESGWYRKHKTEGLGYPHYSGAIHIFSETGTLLSSVTLASGIPVQKTTQDDTYVAHRANDQEMTCEVIDIDYVGGCAGEECWWSEIIITLNCTGAGGGGSDGMYDDGGYGQGGANGPQHEDGQHGGGGGGSPVTTVPVEDEEEPPVEEEDMDDQIIIDTTFVNTPCLMNVYTAMGDSETFKNYLQNFDGDFSVADLNLTVGIHPSFPDASAVTNPSDDYAIQIMFNPNQLNRPVLDVARTMIHELIHAEMYRKLLSLSQQGSIPWSVDFIHSIRNNYPGLHDYYMRYYYDLPEGVPFGDPQHELMAQHYRDIIKQVLREVDDSQTEETYDALSWVGLKDTVAWQHLSVLEQDTIIQIRTLFLLNNSNCQ